MLVKVAMLKGSKAAAVELFFFVSPHPFFLGMDDAWQCSAKQK